MKFGKRLQEEMIEAWAEHYVSYKRLKRIISQKDDAGIIRIEDGGNNAEGNTTIARAKREAFVTGLFAAVRDELSKAERHMEAVEEELRGTFDELTSTDQSTFEVKTPRSLATNSTEMVDFADSSDPRTSLADSIKQLATATMFPRKTRKSIATIGGGSGGGDTGSPIQMTYGQTDFDTQQCDSPVVSASAGSGETDSLARNPIGLASSQYTDNSSNIHTTLVPLDRQQPNTEEDVSQVPDRYREKSTFDTILSCIKWKSEEEKASDNSRLRYLAWYGSASRLLHFADLNLEAVRKASKKVAKYHPEVGDLTSRFADEIQASYLTRSMRDLEGMIDRMKLEFNRRFDTSLEKYGDLSAGKEVWHCKWRYVVLALIVYILAICAPIFKDDPPAHSCVALFAVIVTLWISEAIPFFCTAMLIPLLAVPTSIIQDPDTGETANATIAAKVMLSHVFDHVQILVLGGLTIAKAMSRTRLELLAAAKLHQLTAHSPNLYLLGVMVLSCVVCIFVSNVASPLLVLGVIHSTLWEFPQDTTAPQGILLGLAFACNLGGMLSPIASPQNAVAMHVLGFSRISFVTWVALAVPIVSVTLIGAWLIILWIWKPFEYVQYIPLQNGIHSTNNVPRSHVYFVCIVSAITIILWCLPPDLFFGDTGIIALIPIVCFFGVGILKKDDFNNLSWHLMFLLAGGNMLGVCAKDSKMLDLLAASLQDRLETQAPYITLVAILLIVCFITTFVSHTVAAMILLPIIAKIGSLIPSSASAVSSHKHGGGGGSSFSLGIDITPELLVFLSTLMCSAAMAFPISSFPNVNSLLAEDDLGRPYLKAKDFLVTGLLVTAVFFVSCATWMVPYFNLVM